MRFGVHRGFSERGTPGDPRHMCMGDSFKGTMGFRIEDSVIIRKHCCSMKNLLHMSQPSENSWISSKGFFYYHCYRFFCFTIGLGSIEHAASLTALSAAEAPQQKLTRGSVGKRRKITPI